MRLCALAVAAVLGLSAPSHATEAGSPADDAFAANRRLGRGINLGNALEAPREGDWGLTIRDSFFEEIREAGFDSVRIPIRWSSHAAEEPPYTVDPEFFERVDHLVEQALARELNVVLNVHHYDEIYRDARRHRARFLALWRQIAERYREQPDRVYFELLNEPHTDLDAEAWNALIAETLKVVRETNPDRYVIVGPTQWNHVEQLPSLELPEEDGRIIATFHYYLPFKFTHQGAEWSEGAEEWLGTTWEGTAEEQQAIREHFDAAAEWSRKHRRPLYVGEFGAYHKADMDSRVRWTEFISQAAEERGFSWAYWEFGAGFGAYDREAEAWRRPLLDALVPPAKRTPESTGPSM